VAGADWPTRLEVGVAAFGAPVCFICSTGFIDLSWAAYLAGFLEAYVGLWLFGLRCYWLFVPDERSAFVALLFLTVMSQWSSSKTKKAVSSALGTRAPNIRFDWGRE